MSDDSEMIMADEQEPVSVSDMDSARKLQDAFANIKKQLSQVIVGQDHVIEELLTALFSKGHCILEGVPGLAKTLMISTLPEERVKRYDEGIRNGGILMGVRPRNDEDATHLESAWKTNRAQDVYR